MFSLLCSLAFYIIEEVINSHLVIINMSIINQNANYNVISNIVYGNTLSNQYEFIKTNNNVSCTCIGIENSTIYGIENYIDMIIESYLDNNKEFIHNLWYNDLKYTCTLYDFNNDNLWMISDNIGSTPLWYSFPNKNDNDIYNFIVTTDLILAYRLGFKFLTPLGAGQLICIDLHNNEIIKIHQWQSDLPNQSKYDNIENVEMYSFRMISSSLKILNNYQNIDQSSIEIDHIIPSSLLLDCTIQALDKNYYTHISQPLVSDSILPKSDIFSLIIQDIPDLRNIMTAVWSPKFIRVAADRWNFCANSVSKVIFSHDCGMFPRPLEIYFQNLFCSILGVEIIYPFRSLDFQLKLWGTGYPHSYFHNAVNSLREIFSCDDYKPRTFSSEFSDITSTISNDPKASNRSHLSELWKVANKYAAPDGYIVVVLATSGYSDLLQNFLCSTTKVNSKYILVLTPNDDIADIARNAGVGFIISAQWENININISIADFGTLLYQELILFRTETITNLLLLGFNPIVADIDTVWLEDPIELLRAEQKIQSFDIAITDDNGEVCGCFVALHNTPDSLTFWKRVSQLHRELLIKGRETLESVREFSESEQKILTNLLLHGAYQKKLRVIVLSDSAFPSGYNYFNLRQSINDNDNSRGKPVVVHNNYIIGKGMKKIRFVRYNLWNYNSQSLLMCSYDPLVLWMEIADRIDKNIKIPILSLILPIHNSIITSSLLMAQAHTEGSLFNISSGRFWLETNPPNYINFQTLGVYQLDVKKSNKINSLSIALDQSKIAISADVGVNRSVFSFDRNGNAHDEANERVLKAKRLSTAGGDTYSINLKCINICNTSDVKVSELDTDHSGDSSDRDNANVLSLDISIKVLAYNRPFSLSRLLNSLSNADYLGHSISLEIFVDGPASDDDANLVEKVKAVSREFEWAYGSKSLTFRDVNYGLAKQWYSAWDPISNNEVAFIFEDDLEVSPYFFIWTYQVLSKYYVNDEDQRSIQTLLLKAVENHIKNNGTIESKEEIKGEFPTSIEDFVSKTAGEPIIYGICLQKQHVDAPRYPKALEIRNGHRPFLYSLIGSWGPLLLPSPWQAFRQWWIWALEKGLDISTENTIVNHFLKSNPKIWTPLMVRFAFETGAKCLYPNLPGNLSLITNHRERGENYDISLGPDSKHLGRDDVNKIKGLMTKMEVGNSNSSPDSVWHRFIAQTSSDRLTLELHYSINYLPSLTSLAEWQYDLNLRRAGSMASDRLFNVDLETVRKSNVMKEFLMAHERINQSKLFYQNAGGKKDDAILSMSNDHISEVMNLLDNNLLPGASFFHLGVSPILELLIVQYPLHLVITNDNNHVLLENNIQKRVHWIYIDGDNFNLEGFHDKDFDIGVVHLPSILNSSSNNNNNENSNDSFLRILRYLKFDYLLVLSNSCSGSPTDLNYMNDDSSSLSYSLIEDVCAEADEDVGASLFRKILNDTEDDWYSNRYIISRRIKTSSEILVTRRAITPK